LENILNMRKWGNQVKISKFGICDVVEHTDSECNRPRTDGQYLAPASHGFVCLYRNGKYLGWCGGHYAEKKQILKKKKDKFLE
jgi:hypothetical protein